MNIQNESHESIVARIREDTIIIESRAEFERLIEQSPERASLHRAYADFLLSRGDHPQAVMAYERATTLYLGTGRSLQAIVATILAWSITKPTHDQGRLFHAAVQSAITAETPLQNFFAALSYPELVAVMLRLVRLKYPANFAVKNFGDKADELFFIVSGTLKETTYLSTGTDESDRQASVRQLFDNDIFGDIYPLAMDSTSRSDVESLSHVELVKINRQVLQSLCQKHPRVELLLAKLHKDPDETQDGRVWSSVRRFVRHEIPTKVDLTIFPGKEDDPPVKTAGFTRDISLGGACVDLGEMRWSTPVEAFKNARVNIEIKLPNAGVTLKLGGAIVWVSKDAENTKTSILVGIQFDPLSDSDRNALEAYCSGGDAEQNLLWNLWDDYMKS
ncbi:MAG: PilZ domain-containing protein [Deltaproteobacteria bacterium]|nr:PilZ domain-containing protein [Deltaproteobacteria bacterium]